MSSKRPENPKGRSGSGSSGQGPARSGSGSARSGSDREPQRVPPSQADIGEIARAVSTSFLILVFGALVQPVAGSVLPLAIGQFWLIAVAIIAFAIAGARCGPAGPNPPLYGAGGALGAFLLVIPLQFIQGTFDPLYALYTLVAALVVGAVAGQLRFRLRSPS